VQIPNEDDDDEAGTSTLSPHATTAATRTPIQNPGAVLPPPSPSAGALLSAGASGPPNPFARPPPPNGPNGFNSGNNRNDIETPISALPSRFVSDQLLPSPGGFYSDWFNGRDNNMLPSPLTFPTPVAAKATGFGEEDERKRKLEESSNAPEKRVKT
jgi:MADS-box transcription factor